MDVRRKGVDEENMGVGSKSDVVGKDKLHTHFAVNKESKTRKRESEVKGLTPIDDDEDDPLHRSSIFKCSKM